MKHEDLKCEFCDGQGEKEKNIDGMDCPVTCTFCNGTGIDQDQLRELNKPLINEIEQLILHAEEDSLDYSVLEHARKLVFTTNHPK